MCNLYSTKGENVLKKIELETPKNYTLDDIIALGT